MRRQDLLSVVRTLSGHPVGLHALASRAGWSPFHLHRALHRLLGETPKQYALRLRLERAAQTLLSSDRAVRAIAADVGFSSHEVFTRSFVRHFGRAPRDYRRFRRHAVRGVWQRHAALGARISPCLRLFHLSSEPVMRSSTVPLSISRKDCPQQPILYIRRSIPRSELQGMLGECYGKLFGYGHQAGLPVAGWPIARYIATGPGLWTVDAVMPLSSPAQGVDDMVSGALHAGPAAFAVHAGPYESLPETYAALERWMQANGCQPAEAPWECYVTDPAQLPNPADWRTEVYWPIK